MTGKPATEVFIRDKGLYRWNSAYEVYNSIKGYDQLQKEDVEKIDWNKSK